MKRPLTPPDYDIGRGEIARIGRLSLLWKVFPFGSHGGGPGWKCVVLLCVLHRLGRPFWLFAVRYEEKLHALYQRLRGKAGA